LDFGENLHLTGTLEVNHSGQAVLKEGTVQKGAS
jgi:hypothetical protein